MHSGRRSRSNKNNVTSIDWVSYPILRFKGHPNVTNVLVLSGPISRRSAPVSRSRARSTGAIANAFFDATGVRLHEAPMTPGRVRATLKAAGVI